ncbi:hypothetical protein TNCV_4427881 [Trichonephila clavipes]|nr:hypothetical protein TNCV_4427881 [Trichonephila clavipes]
MTRSVSRSRRVAEQCDVNIHVGGMWDFGKGPESWYPSGYGHELMTGVSRVRVLIPLKTRLVEGVEAQSPPVDVLWKLEEVGALRCRPRHLTEV